MGSSCNYCEQYT
ncbi:hypothetical protein ECEC1847_1693, partial [Escherichia coli EC1847]